MATKPSDHERAAAGMDYDGPFRERASSIGSSMAENGPEALFNEIENLLPENLREHVRSYPITAVVIGVGIGVFLGLKKSAEIIAAGTSLISAAAMANVGEVMKRAQGGDEE